MSKRLNQLAFRALAVAVLAVLGTLAVVPAQASTPISTSYSRTSVSGTMPNACQNAIELIEDDCDVHGPITTTPNGCHTHPAPLGQICKCTATTTFCGIIPPGAGNPPKFP